MSLVFFPKRILDIFTPPKYNDSMDNNQMVLQEYQIPEGRSTTPSKPNVGIVEKTNLHSTFFNQQPKNVLETEGNLDHGSLHENKTKKKNRL